MILDWIKDRLENEGEIGCFEIKKKICRRLADRIKTCQATLKANNPSLRTTFIKERCKKAILKKMFDDRLDHYSDTRDNPYKERTEEGKWIYKFTLRDFQNEALEYYQPLADYKTAERLLEANVYVKELKKEGKNYIFDGDVDALDRVVLPF